MNNLKPTITLSGTRGDEWERVLGTRTFAVLSPDAEVLPLEHNGNAECVFLDIDSLSLEQQDALIEHFASKSGMLKTAARREIYSRGVPIRIGADARLDVPAEYQKRRKMMNGPDAFDMRFFS